MLQTTATITSKRQLTIPIALFKKLGFKENQQVTVRENKGIMEIESTLEQVKRLAGSVKVPKRFSNMDLDEIIEKARDEYFLEKRKSKDK